MTKAFMRDPAERGIPEPVNQFRRRATESETVAVAILDSTGRFLLVNQRAGEVTGYSDSELKGQSYTFLVANDDRRRVSNLVEIVLVQERSLFRVEASIIRKDGTLRTISFDMGPIRLNVTTSEAAAAADGVTMARRTEEGSRESQESYRFLVETTTDVVLAVNNEGKILFANPAVEQMLGYKSSELVGKDIRHIIPSSLQSHDRHWTAYFEVQKELLAQGAAPFPLMHKKGHEIVVDVTLGRFKVEGKVLFAALVRDITRRTEYEKVLHENEERLRLALKAGKMRAWDWDTQTDIVTWHREFSEAMGLELSLIQSREAWLRTVHPDDRARLQQVVTKSLNDRREYYVEYRITPAGDPVRWVEERGLGVYDETGNCITVRGLIGDVTERKRVEQELSVSEERYRNIVENQADLICRFLPDTTLTFVNDAYCRYFGRRRKDLIGMKFLELIPKDLQSEIWSYIQSLIKTPADREVQLEHQVITPGGGLGWMHWMNRVIVDADNNVNELQGIGRDITELKRLEQNLTRSEQEFSRLVENSPDIISRLDRELRFLYISPIVTPIFGLPPQTFVGKTTGETGVHMHDSPGFERTCQKVFATGRPAYREFSFRGKWYRSRIIPEFQANGTIDSVMCIDQDVTEQKRIEAELRLLSSRLLDLQDAERRRIARELHDGTAQNLFAINIGLSRLLQHASTEDLRTTLQECLSLCEQSREEIRTLSYLLHPPMLDEAGLVSALKWYVEGFSKRSGIRVDLTANHGVGRLPIDIETDLFRVVQECLANIHRHSGSPNATVQLERDSEHVTLQIRDWGHGMPAEVSSNTLVSPGVGIPGMRERLGQHNGSLEIKSGQTGTTITAVVPLSSKEWPFNPDVQE